MTPYADPRHVGALARDGTHRLPIANWGGANLLLRPIPGTTLRDAAGPYPLLPFESAWRVEAGLQELRAAGAISAVIVADPLAPPAALDAFEMARPFKRHHLVLGQYSPSEHHRAELRRAARRCEVAEAAYDEAWPVFARLYAELVARKGIAGGAQDFDAAYFAALAPLRPRLFAAWAGGQVVAMSLWFIEGDRAWYHLAASGEAGRATAAGYAVVDAAIRALLRDGVARILLGGGLAEAHQPPCGLDRFKAGFANEGRVNLLLGAVLEAESCALLGGAAGAFFPAYRARRLAA